MSNLVLRLRSRRGVALPVALVGLVAMSLLVTTALLTSTTESAISAAQALGARTLYNAEGGLNEYLRQIAVAATPLQAGVQTVTLAESGAQVRVTTTRLQWAQLNAAGGFNATFALTAEPLVAGQPAGRAVVAMIRQTQPSPQPLATNITSAITLGGDLNVNGNAFTVNGRFTGCGVTNGVDAVRSSVDSNVTANNARHMQNFLGVGDNGQNTSGRAAIDSTGMTKLQLANDVLGGKTLAEIIAPVPAAKRWGPQFNRPVWDGRIDAGEEVAVVDAAGGEVEVLGGSGLLIVINGSMRMKGNAAFEGIIIVEGNFTLSGNPQIRGALISLADAYSSPNIIDQDDSAIANGNITVQFDKCMVQQAEQAFGRVAGNQPPSFTTTTFGWSEVIR